MTHNVSGVLYEHTITGEQDNQLVVMVNHWAFLDVGINDNVELDIADIGAYLQLNYEQNVLPLQLNAFQLRSMKTLAIQAFDEVANPANPIPFIEAKDERAVSGTGGITPGSDPMPTFNAVGIRKLVQKEGRGYRGSTRLICLQESDVNHNTIAQAKIDAIQTGMDVYWEEAGVTTGGTTSNLYGVVFARSQLVPVVGAGADPGLLATAAITGAFVNKFVSSQVSRKRRDRLG